MKSSPSSRYTLRSLLTLLVAVGCGTAIAFLQLPQLQKLSNKTQLPPRSELERDLQAEKVRLALWQKLPSFGYDNLIADWAFLNFLQYFGDTPVREQTDYTLSPDYFEVVIDRNPFFLEAYTFLSTSAALYAGLPERSVALMTEGVAALSPNLPGAHYVWRNKAIDELLFLGDAKMAQRSFETAAQWADASGDSESQNVAELSRQTAQFLATNPDSKTAQVAAWSMVLSTAPDDRTRKIAIGQIQQLGGQIVARPDGTFGVVPPAED